MRYTFVYKLAWLNVISLLHEVFDRNKKIPIPLFNHIL
jgi:hypothetical protein